MLNVEVENMGPDCRGLFPLPFYAVFSRLIAFDMPIVDNFRNDTVLPSFC